MYISENIIISIYVLSQGTLRNGPLLAKHNLARLRPSNTWGSETIDPDHLLSKFAEKAQKAERSSRRCKSGRIHARTQKRFWTSLPRMTLAIPTSVGMTCNA